MVCAFEQRSSKRTELRWPVSVWHPKAGRFFTGHSVDVSKGGAMVELPLTSPLRQGQSLEVNFPRGKRLSAEKGVSARIKTARVVRIDRSASVEHAVVRVGLAFESSLCPENQSTMSTAVQGSRH